MKIDTNLLFFGPLFSKLIEPFHYETGSRTVEDVHRRTSDPGLQFIDGHRDILCIILEIRLRSVSDDYLGFKIRNTNLVKYPYLSVISWSGNTMPVVVKQYTFFLCISSHGEAQLLHILNSGIEALAIFCLVENIIIRHLILVVHNCTRNCHRSYCC